MKGTLTKWDDERGIGFVRPDDPRPHREVFVHEREVIDRTELRAGQRLEFDVEPAPDGRGPVATNVCATGRESSGPNEFIGTRRGWIRKFDAGRGFGFLKVRGMNRGLFFHVFRSPSLDPSDPAVTGGLPVEFETEHLSGDRPEAVNVRRIAPEHSGNEGKVTQWQPE